MGATGVQRIVQDKLQSKWYNLDSMLDSLIDIAENATTSTPDWTPITDYKTRFNVRKYMMEAAGYYQKQKQQGVNLQFNFTDEIMRKNG